MRGWSGALQDDQQQLPGDVAVQEALPHAAAEYVIQAGPSDGAKEVPECDVLQPGPGGGALQEVQQQSGPEDGAIQGDQHGVSSPGDGVPHEVSQQGPGGGGDDGGAQVYKNKSRISLFQSPSTHT